MSTSQGYVALDWVRGEIEQTLTLARNALELYASDREDPTQVGFCLNYLHQVQGTLKMVELQGAAIFTAEMESLSARLRDREVSSFEESVECLMAAILRLQNYLESVTQPEESVPAQLLPVYNDLRAAQGQSFDSEESSGELDLTPAKPTPRPELNARMSKDGVIENLRKLRQMLQGALAGIIRNQNVDDRLEYFVKVISKLEKFCKGSPIGALWWIALGFVETQKGQGEPLGSAVKQLLRDLDTELKKMIESPDDALTRPVSDELLRNLLFYIAKSDSEDSHVADIRGLFSLQEVETAETAEPQEQKALGPDKDTMASVSAVIIDELASLKDKLDLIERNASSKGQDLKDLIPSFKQLEGTLAVIGVEQARNAVVEQINALEALDSDELSEDLMMELADAVLTVEAQVSHLKDDPDSIHQEGGFSVPSEQFESAHSAVIAASKASLEKAKNAIVGFITSQWDHKYIAEVPQVLDEVRGGLLIIPLEEAANLISLCGDYIQNKLLGEKVVPDWSQLDRLADAISSIEYYIERVAEGASRDSDRFLNVARESLQQLGQFEDDGSEIKEDQHSTSHHISEAAAEAPDTKAKASDEELIDQEILEIFAEEVGEVGEEIDAALSALRSNEEDAAALAELRRAFHTLKGSGRLVGAGTMGELAWGVESRLNAIIDQQASPNLTELAAIQRIRDSLNDLLDDFSNGGSGELAQELESQLVSAFGESVQTGDVADSEESTAEAEIEQHADETDVGNDTDLEEPSGTEEVAEDLEHVTVEAPVEYELEDTSEQSDAAQETASIEEASEQPTEDLEEEAVVEENESLIDEEILEIFIEEAEEVLETIQEYLPRFTSDYDDNEALVELRRAFHTLKGSGRMVEAFTIGDIAWAVENLLNRIIDRAVEMRPAIGDFVSHVASGIPALVENFKSGTALPFAKEEIEDTAQRLLDGENVSVSDAADVEMSTAAVDETPQAELVQENIESETAGGTEGEAEEAPSYEVTDDQFDVSEDSQIDPLMEIFEAEALQHIATVEAFAKEVKEGGERPVDDALSRALHTLKGSANTADIQPIAKVAIPLESLTKEVRAHQLAVDEKMADLLDKGMQLIRTAVGQLAQSPQADIAGSDDYLNALAAYKEKRLSDIPETDDLSLEGAQDPQLVGIFLTEGLDILLDAERVIDEWQEGEISNEDFGKLYTEVTTLKRGAKVANLPAIIDICGALEECYASIHKHEHEPDRNMISSIKEGHDALIDMMDQTAAGLSAKIDQSLISRLEQIAQDHAALASGETIAASDEDLLEQSLGELESSIEGVIPEFKGTNLEAEAAEDFAEEAQEPVEEQVDAEGSDAESTEIELSTPPIPDVEEDLVEQEAVEDVVEEEAVEAEGAGGLAELDPELAEIFLEEAQDLIEHSSELLHQWEQASDDFALVGELQRDLHTLKGGARMAEVSAIGDLAHELETLFEKTVESQTVASPEVIQLCLKCHDALAAMVDAVGQNTIPAPATALLNEVRNAVAGKPLATAETLRTDTEEQSARANEDEVQDPIEETPISEPEVELQEPEVQEELVEHLEDEDSEEQQAEAIEELPEAEVEEEPVEAEGAGGLAELDPELAEIFLEEAQDLIEHSSELLHQWEQASDDFALVGELQRDLHTLKGGARMAEVSAIGDLAHELETLFEKTVESQTVASPEVIQLCLKCHDALAAMVDAVGQNTIPSPATALLHEVQNAVAGKPIDLESAALEATSEVAKAIQVSEESFEEQASDEPILSDEESETDTPEQVSSSSEPVVSEEQERPEKTAAISSKPAKVDQDDFDQEVLEMFAEEAQELVEALETNLADWAEAPQEQHFNQELQRVLHTLKGGARLASLDDLAEESHKLESRLIKAFESGEEFSGDLKDDVHQSQDVLISLVKTFLEPEQKQAEKAPEAKPESKEQEVSDGPQVITKLGKKQPDQPPVRKQDKKAASQETVRISANLIDGLVNLAGETSISRGRIEQQISDFSFTLEEMNSTIERLREQLRRMEMETEAQVLYRAEQEGFTVSDYEEFDPLEMDRYSSIQTLSRALSESATDLTELRETLADRARDAETVLLQQSRINSELQESLMKTRMIPFSSMVPRLRRIVRQISGELDKAVDFNVANAEGEMDRSVLDRMIAPLEHMLRNALDHGIENKDKRIAAGKPETGRVDLSMSREGGDIVIRMKDDGGGIDDQRVLEKAVSQGLAKSGVSLPRQEILQFIMSPGFSTAAQVTQISGRGVGMDVVASEIKSLGGSITIESELGKGTEFTVRLPFTVSVNRALMVSTGDDFYAIPLNTIEGIVRVSPYELEEYYQADAPPYRYAGRDYNLKYLGTLLHSSHHPKLTGQSMPLPVILVRGSESPMALQVDQLMGSREIVVKSLGPQFGNVHGVSGATILGDGSVVVILDLPAMIRDETAGILDVLDKEKTDVDVANRTPIVMVVDDSVTVRKVTSRFLERNGLDVVTAKDGVDAIAQLQDVKPDVMLLDIEMPRMDGFEVATLVRHDERLKDVPIIMITSRTGQKHRDRAMSIGVNEYMGKPFQEQQLLEQIEAILAKNNVEEI